MARVIYDSKAIIPVEFVTISRSFNRSQDGQIIGEVYPITLQGVLVAEKGSPNSSGVFWTGSGYPADENIGADSRFGAIIRKQEALQTLFCNEGRTLECAPLDGSLPFKCNPRVIDVNFEQGTWFDYSRYNISLEADKVYLGNTDYCENDFPQYIEDINESWSFETSEDRPENINLPRTYNLSHSLSAKGKRFYNEAGTLVKPAWQQARDWCISRLGFDSEIALSSGVNNLPSYYTGYNHIRNQEIDETGGLFSVTETWILASGSALEDFNIQIVDPAEGYKSVSIEGNITGLELRSSDLNVISSKFQNAESKFSGIYPLLLTRAQAYAGITLNPIPLSVTIGKNPIGGTINYTVEYDTRPTNLITSTKSEVISINNSWDVDIIAVVGVLGRTKGPVLQSLNTHRECLRNLSVELVFDSSYFTNGDSIGTRLNAKNPRFNHPQSGEIQQLVDAANPLLSGATNNLNQPATRTYVIDQSENWDISNLRYSYNVGWIYE